MVFVRGFSFLPFAIVIILSPDFVADLLCSYLLRIGCDFTSITHLSQWQQLTSLSCVICIEYR
jgi:hypothetical protein